MYTIGALAVNYGGDNESQPGMMDKEIQVVAKTKKKP
jgi:hypothetical protein